VKRARATRDALHNESRVLINQNRHVSGKQERRNKEENGFLLSCVR